MILNFPMGISVLRSAMGIALFFVTMIIIHVDLVWLREEAETPQTPTPVVEEKPPTPPPPPSPPTPEVPEDPYDRRLRKARAQMDMSKSAGFLAVEELVKAQETHMRLKRQFQEAQMDEDIKNRRQVSYMYIVQGEVQHVHTCTPSKSW